MGSGAAAVVSVVSGAAVVVGASVDSGAAVVAGALVASDEDVVGASVAVVVLAGAADVEESAATDSVGADSVGAAAESELSTVAVEAHAPASKVRAISAGAV